MLEVDCDGLATIGCNRLPLRNGSHVVIAAFCINIGPCLLHHCERRVLFERNDKTDRFQCRQKRHPVVAIIEGTIVTLTQPLHRCIGVDGDNQRCSQCTCLREVGDVAAMQNVEYAVGQDDRLGELRDARNKIGTRTEFFFEIRHKKIKSRKEILAASAYTIIKNKEI